MAPHPGQVSGQGPADVFSYNKNHQMPRFVQPVSESDKCISCRNIFRPPIKQIVQCGHRICGKCVEQGVESHIYHCPGYSEENNDDCGKVDLRVTGCVLPDFSKQREFQKMQVFCFLCSKIVNFGGLELHLKFCRPTLLMTPPPADAFTYELQMPRFVKPSSSLPKCVSCLDVLRPPVKQITRCGHKICGVCEKQLKVSGITSCSGKEDLCKLVDIREGRSILPDYGTQREMQQLEAYCFLCSKQVTFGEFMLHLRLCKPRVLMTPCPTDTFVYSPELKMPLFVKPLSVFTKCVFCNKFMRPPVMQIVRCGHRICRVCVDALMAEGQTKCPGNEQKCNEVNIHLHRSVMPDIATQREFQEFDIHCYKCYEKMKFKDFECHVGQCM